MRAQRVRVVSAITGFPNEFAADANRLIRFACKVPAHFATHQVMYRFRRLIALLLMVTLPAYAWAALALPTVCPMQSSPMMAMAEVEHACCDLADGEFGQPDKPHSCKPGQECKGSNLYQPLFPGLAQPFVAAATGVPELESRILSRDPTGIWRPPRSV